MAGQHYPISVIHDRPRDCLAFDLHEFTCLFIYFLVEFLTLDMIDELRDAILNQATLEETICRIKQFFVLEAPAFFFALINMCFADGARRTTANYL